MTVYDLTQPILASQPNISIEPDNTYINHGITMTHLTFQSHAGTHMDAPRHFLPEGPTMEQMDLDKCVGPALILDMTHIEPNGFIKIEDCQPYAEKISQGSRILFRTDWGQYHGTPRYSEEFPRIHVSTAEWLADRGVVLVGVEHPSVAALHNMSELIAVHHALLKHDIVIVEGLTNLNQLPEEVQFIALPLNIVGGDGCPTRAIAVT